MLPNLLNEASKLNSNPLAAVEEYRSEIEDYTDLISKLTRYCKELTSTNDTKIMIARRMTTLKQQPAKIDKVELEKMKKKVSKKK